MGGLRQEPPGNQVWLGTPGSDVFRAATDGRIFVFFQLDEIHQFKIGSRGCEKRTLGRGDECMFLDCRCALEMYPRMRTQSFILLRYVNDSARTRQASSN